MTERHGRSKSYSEGGNASVVRRPSSVIAVDGRCGGRTAAPPTIAGCGQLAARPRLACFLPQPSVRRHLPSVFAGQDAKTRRTPRGDGADALADGPFPTSFYDSTSSATQVGPEGANGYSYTPTAGQPGFVAGAAGPVTHDLISDGVITPSARGEDVPTIHARSKFGIIAECREMPRRPMALGCSFPGSPRLYQIWNERRFRRPAAALARDGPRTPPRSTRGTYRQNGITHGIGGLKSGTPIESDGSNVALTVNSWRPVARLSAST